MSSENVAWIPAQTELIMADIIIRHEVVRVHNAHRKGLITDEQIRKFLANPNIVFGCHHEEVSLGEVPKAMRIVHVPESNIPDVVLAGDKPVYWCQENNSPVDGPVFLMVGVRHFP